MSREFDIQCSQKSNVIDKFLTTNPLFVCVISYTETSQVPGITFAGANPDLIKYTSPADSEFLFMVDVFLFLECLPHLMEYQPQHY